MFFVMVLVDVIIVFSFLFIALRKGDIHIKKQNIGVFVHFWFFISNSIFIEKTLGNVSFKFKHFIVVCAYSCVGR